MSDADPAAAWGNNPQYVADDFTLSAAAQVTAFRWWGSYAYGNPMSPYEGTPQPESNFSIRLFNDSSGTIGGLLASYPNVGGGDRMLVSLPGVYGTFQGYEFRYTLESPLSLAAGTKYWISIFDNTVGSPSDSFFAIAKSSETNWMATRAADGQSEWFAVSGSNPGPAFSLVPEPATLAIALAGIACSGYLVRRRKRA